MTDAERARIMTEVEATLRRADFPSSAPPREEPVRERPLPEPEDAMDRWRREAEAQEVRRAAAKAALRAEERATERADWSAWTAYIDGRISAALTEQQNNVAELARGSVEFSNAVSARLAAMEKLLERLNTKLVELRSLDDVRRGGIIDMPSPLVRRVN
jgi:hypothetical protein